MKIAVITPFYEPSIGGVQQTARILAEYFASQGCQVRVYTGQRQRMDELPLFCFRRRTDRLPFRHMENGVEVFRFPAGGLLDGLLGFLYAVAFKIYRPAAPFFYNAYQRRLVRWGRLRREFLAFRPEGLYAAPCVDYLMDICSRLIDAVGGRWVVHTALHLSDQGADDQRSGVARLERADAIFANTEHEKQYLVSRGLDASKVHIPGVCLDLKHMTSIREEDADPAVVERLSGRTYLLYFGRKQEKKGLEELIEAFHIVRADHPGVLLVLAGEDTEHFLKNVAPGLNGQTDILTFGRQDEPTKRWLFSHARVFSMVSRVDSFGIVYLESWLYGRPVIGADDRQMCGVIRDKEDGFLVPPQGPRALAQRLGILLQYPALADKMGENGRKKVLEVFGEHVVEKKTLGLLKG